VVSGQTSVLGTSALGRSPAGSELRRWISASSPPLRPRSWCAAGLVYGYVWLHALIHNATPPHRRNVQLY
jgi:hypothetical protein